MKSNYFCRVEFSLLAYEKGVVVEVCLDTLLYPFLNKTKLGAKYAKSLNQR